jgi:hypothetical protein
MNAVVSFGVVVKRSNDFSNILVCFLVDWSGCCSLLRLRGRLGPLSSRLRLA